jgi:hypothetical protein
VVGGVDFTLALADDEDSDRWRRNLFWFYLKFIEMLMVGQVDFYC